MRSIPLTNGGEALVDDEDFAKLSAYAWHRHDGRKTSYAQGCKGPMHRVILGLAPRDPRKGDHRDGNGLNNQRYNLRIASVGQNRANTTKPISSARGPHTSNYKGVAKVLRGGIVKWMARMSGDVLGVFAKEEDAARAYDKEAVVRYGEFANLNFPV